ncbi:MAG: transposase, partial [Candidatus Tectomicrobia bacterium]|nr:transposase [Candidatus Tectomicrobia bacterium]
MSMTPQYSHTTRLNDYIAFMLPWAHGHQLKGITAYVSAIIEQQTGCQAQLARYFDNQEAAVKRLSRLLHNERLDPKVLADAVLLQAIHQLPETGKIRLAIDWTIEDKQHLLVVSLIRGRRGVPIYWRAYDASVLKGRMKRYETAVVRRAVTRVIQAVGKRRVIVTADRGFADVALFTLLGKLGIRFIIRVKSGTHVQFQGHWCPLGQIKFRRNERHRSLGDLLYCKGCPQRLWVSKSRARDAKGNWGIWHLISNHPYNAKRASDEYGRRFGCEEGFRDAKWWLGFAKSRIGQIKAWSRMFALFSIALLVMTTL